MTEQPDSQQGGQPDSEPTSQSQRPSMRERMLAGDRYRADDPEIAADHQRAMALVEAFNASPAVDPAHRRRLLTALLGAFGEGSEIRPPFHCDYGHQISFGARTFANFGLIVLDVATVTVGDDVQIGPRVQLLTATHPLEPHARRAKWESAAPISIADNVWLGAGVIVCPGVSIGENTVVGAGSVVLGDLPADVLAAGTPARILRPLAAEG